MRTASLALFGIAVAVVSSVRVGTAAPVPKHLMKEPPDLAALRGTWTLTGLRLEGTELPVEIIRQVALTLEFRENTAVMTSVPQKRRTTATVKLDATTKPRRMTFGNESTTDLDGKPVKGAGESMGTVIYKIDGDTLVLAGIAQVGDKKPEGVADDFVGKPGSNVAVLTFKRVKP
jgi:uncharacterized protein (TIGR03067 family)